MLFQTFQEVEEFELCALSIVSIRVMNFYLVGSKLVRFLAKIEHTPKEIIIFCEDIMPGPQNVPKIRLSKKT